MRQVPAERPLFLHFFDVHYLAEVGVEEPVAPRVREEMALAVRLALLASDEVLVPAASYFESPSCRATIDALEPIFDRGRIWLVAAGSKIHEFAVAKLLEYRPGTMQHRVYSAVLDDRDVDHPPFRSRHRSSTADLHEHWIRMVQAGRVPSTLGSVPGLPSDIEERWEQMPERLGADAFIVDYIQPLILPDTTNPILESRLHGVVNAGYFGSYAQELEAGFVVDMHYLASRGPLPSAAPDLPFHSAVEGLRAAELLEEVVRASPEGLLELAENPEVKAVVGWTIAPWRARRAPVRQDGASSVDDLVQEVRDVPLGRESARHVDTVFALLGRCFEEALTPHRTEARINQGRKRIDAVFVNDATEGFFLHVLLARQMEARVIPVECKNYTGDIGNHEIDQLLGRFDPRRGFFGFLVCRRLEDRARVVDLCRDAAQSRRGYAVVLTDDDLAELAGLGTDQRVGGGQYRFLMGRLNEVTS